MAVALSSTAPSGARAESPGPDPLPDVDTDLPASLLPSECAEADACLCVKGTDVDRLNALMVRGEEAAARAAALDQAVAEAEARGRAATKPEWWQAPGVVVSGVVVSFAVGGVFGWLAARR